MRSRKMYIIIIAILLIGGALGVVYSQLKKDTVDPTAQSPTPVTAVTAPTGSPQAAANPSSSPSGNPSSNPSSEAPTMTNTAAPDLDTDASGLSKATVTMTTTKGVIKYKFYSKDAPNTVKRMVELIGKGFYNGLTFHRVVPGFVIQGGDPVGNGTGGSGQRLKAEFNDRKHVEGAVAMARANDPDSADSQFYISLGTHPHLDHSYTVFGQVIEGMDVAKKITVGDKMTTVSVQ